MTAQTQTMGHAQNNGSARVARVARTLDDLAKLDARELRAVYDGGTVPESLAVLDGDLVGRMLAVRRLDRGGALRGIAALSRAKSFPWEGKSFLHDNETTGTGINRVKLPGGMRQPLPFAPRVGGTGGGGPRPVRRARRRARQLRGLHGAHELRGDAVGARSRAPRRRPRRAAEAHVARGTFDERTRARHRR